MPPLSSIARWSARSPCCPTGLSTHVVLDVCDGSSDGQAVAWGIAWQRGWLPSFTQQAPDNSSLNAPLVNEDDDPEPIDADTI